MLPPLTLELEFARAEQAGDPYAFRCTPQEYLLRSDGGGFEGARLPWDASLLSDLDAARRPGRDPVILARLGELLRQFLTPLGWTEHAQRILEASRQGRRVLVSFRSAAAELYALPWELLTIKATGQHLGELAGVVLRYEWPETTTTEEQPVPRHGSGRILFAWSAAGGTVPQAAHEAAIQRACAAGTHPFDPSRDVLAHASLGQLGAVLSAARKDNQPISVLHLLCHGAAVGNTFGLALNGETPGSDPVVVDAGRLRQVLAPYASMVRLVVLSACDSGNTGTLGNQLGSVAQTLHRAGFATVVASRYPLSGSGSNRLAASLYQGLLCGPDSLESAFLAAREAMAEDAAQLDWASVQLYARAADGNDTRPLVFRPYAGLQAFGIEQQRFYFGREALTDKIWRRCKELFDAPSATRLLALLGPSGSGKSSVMRAGLFAEIARRSLSEAAPTRVAIFKPGEHPLRALAKALAAMPMQHPDAPVLVLVDQFEEIYTLCTDPAERDAFVDLLLRGARTPGLPVMIVLTLRSDFIGETQRRHPELNRLFDEQAKIVTAMSADELRRSIAQPAVLVGRPIDEATIELLLREARSSEGALPLLAFALARIWEGMLAGKEPGRTLRELGGVGGALAGEAKQIYEALSPAEQATARRALVRLVKLGEGTRDTRRRAPIRELCGRGQTEASVLLVLRRFASENARMLTLSSDGDETLAEVTHEALFDHWAELRRWIDEGRADRRFHDRVMEAAALWNQDRSQPGRLWRAPDLDLLRKYRERKAEELSPLQEEFLSAAERLQRRERITRGAAVGALVIAALGAAAVFRQQSEQRQQLLLSREVEEGRRQLNEKEDPVTAILWLNRAQTAGSRDPILPDLLRSAMQGVDATQTILLAGKYVEPYLEQEGVAPPVLSAIYSPDGRRVVTRNHAKTALIWDAETGRWIAELKGHTGPVLHAAYSPDGKRIVTTSADKTARIWDAETGRQITELLGHKAHVRSAAFSPDGKRIVTNSEDQTSRVWDAETGQLVTLLKNPYLSAELAAFSPDGKRILTMSSIAANIWDAETGQYVATLNSSSINFLHAMFSPDGKRVVTSNEDKAARLWDSESGALLKELRGHGESVLYATFSPDGTRIVTSSADKTARLWNADSGAPIAVLTGHAARVLQATFSPDGKRIVTTSKDKTARLWDSTSGRLLTELAGHGGAVHSAVFGPDGHRILTASEDNTARVWKAEAGPLRAALTGHQSGVWSTAYSPDGKHIVTADRYYNARRWDARSGAPIAELAGPFQRGIIHTAYSSDGKRIVTSGQDGIARIWDAASGKQLTELSGHKQGIWSAAFSPNGERIVTGSEDNTIRIWDATNGRSLIEIKDLWNVRSVAYSPDGRRIVTSSDDHTARIWDAANGQKIRDLSGHREAVCSVAYSPSGSRIVTSSYDNTARVWDAETGRQLVELKGHRGVVNHAAFSPDGQRIVTASSDKTVRIWEAESGRVLIELKGHGDSVQSAAYSPDGQRIVTASADKTARIWDVSVETRTPAQIARLLRCYVPARFEVKDIITPTLPNPEECSAGEASSSEP